jgi:hypothetical protein
MLPPTSSERIGTQQQRTCVHIHMQSCLVPMALECAVCFWPPWQAGGQGAFQCLCSCARNGVLCAVSARCRGISVAYYRTEADGRGGRQARLMSEWAVAGGETVHIVGDGGHFERAFITAAAGEGGEPCRPFLSGAPSQASFSVLQCLCVVLNEHGVGSNHFWFCRFAFKQALQTRRQNCPEAFMFMEWARADFC